MCPNGQIKQLARSDTFLGRLCHRNFGGFVTEFVTDRARARSPGLEHPPRIGAQPTVQHRADHRARLSHSKGRMKVADVAQLLETQSNFNHGRFRQPGRDYLHTNRQTVAARSEPHSERRHAGQAEG